MGKTKFKEKKQEEKKIIENEENNDDSLIMDQSPALSSQDARYVTMGALKSMLADFKQEIIQVVQSARDKSRSRSPSKEVDVRSSKSNVVVEIDDHSKDEGSSGKSVDEKISDQVRDGFLSAPKVHTFKSFHGKLNEITPASIVKFKDEVDNFEARNEGHVVKVGFYIHKDIVTAVCNKQVIPISSRDFFKLSNAEIYKLLFNYAIPDTAAEWKKVFEQSVKFARSKETYGATATNFDRLFADTQIFMQSFREMYSYMLPPTMEQVKRVVPPFMGTSKMPGSGYDNGMIDGASMVGIFADLCPGGYGGNWNKIIFPYGLRDIKEVKDVDTYLEYVMKRLLAFKTIGIELRPVAEFIGKRHANETVKHNFQKPDTGKREQVFQVSGIGNFKIDSDGDYGEMNDDDPYDDSDDGSNVDENDRYDSDDEIEMIHAINLPVRACFKMVYKGWCENQKNGMCEYSHDKSVIMKARAEKRAVLDRLDKGELEAGKGSTKMVCAVNYDKPPRASDRNRKPRDRNAVHNFKKNKQRKELNSSDSDHIHQLVTIIAGEEMEEATKELCTKVHVHAEFIGFAEPIKFIALMDSGASRDNYLTSEFYTRHEAELEKHSRYCKGSVMLGDGKSRAKIICMVVLPVVFSTNEACRVVELTFVVYEALSTNQDCIIGLRSLLGDCYFIYLEVLKAGRESIFGGIYSLDTEVYVEPFQMVIEESQEELEYDTIPVNFADYLAFMETDYDTCVIDFIAEIPIHCTAEMLAETKLEELLLTKGKKVFVPSNWDGITGIEVELNWKMEPPRRKPECRPVNDRILETAKEEFTRLCKYFYEPSNSDVVSPLVIAPKATMPYIRFCGSYCAINKYIEIGHQPIPHVFHSLEKIAKYSVFADMDLCNSFHQFRLSKTTAARLSVQTPWGQVQPKFMPEGVGPATGILQMHMTRIFKDFNDWSIVLFDNILLMATDFNDLYWKLEAFLDKCIEFNIVLKFSKSWIGVAKVTFFGYECQFQKFGISEKRIKAILDLTFPKDKKSMQSFLGTVVFMQPFTPNFSSIASPLYCATSKGFDWDDLAGVSKLLQPFEELKKAVAACIALYYPDYELQWFLRCDASDVGCGAVLFQKTDRDRLQPLAFLSHKFSPTAQKWSVIERECFACFWAIASNEYYLRCKSFILQTDHRNLQWMENSKTPKVVRWFVMMQSFTFLVQHIPGAHNKVADLLSRLHAMGNISKQEMFESVHGGRQGHFGVKRTYYSLKKQYPTSDITKDEIAEWIKSCAVCQKYKYPAEPSKPPILKSLRAENHRSVIAWDTLEVALNANGDRYLIVVVNLFTKFVHLYPSKTKTAKDIAMCILQYFASYGLMDILHSDPGSEFNNEVVTVLLEWLGVGQSVTLVNNPQADGVERANKETMLLLKMLVADERLKENWSDMSVLPWVQIQINSWVNSSTGYSPFQLQYGSTDVDYNAFPLDNPTKANAFVSKIAENLDLVRKISREIQLGVKLKYSRGTVDIARVSYKPGDFVFLLLDGKVGVGNKLNSRKKGPYLVVEHNSDSNVVMVKDLVSDKIFKFNQKDLQIFVGDNESAVRVARLDEDQQLVDSIVAYVGNPEKRKSLDFLVKFSDDEERWLPYSNDINQTIAFEKFCKSRKELSIVLMPLEEVKQLKREILAMDVDMGLLGKVMYINWRVCDPSWYDWLDLLKDRYKINYVLLAKVLKVSNKSKDYKLLVPLFKKAFLVNNWFIYLHGSMMELGDAVLFDEDVMSELAQLRQNKKTIV